MQEHKYLADRMDQSNQVVANKLKEVREQRLETQQGQRQSSSSPVRWISESRPLRREEEEECPRLICLHSAREAMWTSRS